MPKIVEKITKPCAMCGTLITRIPSWMKGNVCCSKECTKAYKSKRFKENNLEWNKEKMTLEVRTKLRISRLGTGEGKSYEKTFSRHTHRIVAEQKLGRPLKKGEIVHHKDENKKNNHPDNIHVFASQAEHARYHMLKRHGKGYDL